MKQKILLNRLRHVALLCLMLVGSAGNVWGVDVLVYTNDCPKNTKASAYATYVDVTVNNVKWNAPGNQFAAGDWRIGGKGTTAITRYLYTKTSIVDDISKIELTHGAKTAGTVGDIKLDVYSTAALAEAGETGDISSLTVSYVDNGTSTFNRPNDQIWAERFYRITYSVNPNNSKSNKYVSLQSIKFYKNVSAYTLTITSPEETQGSFTVKDSENADVSSGASINQGAELTLSATPQDAYTFTQWNVIGTGSSVESATSASTKFTMGSENATISATFTAKPTYTISHPEPTNGTLVTEDNAYAGKTVEIEVEANTGYELSTLTVTKASSGTVKLNEPVTPSTTSYTFTMPTEAVTVTATFVAAKTYYALTIDGEIVGGSVVANPSVDIEENTEITLTPNANNHYTFTSWNIYKTGEPATTIIVTDNKFCMPAYPVTVSAIFTEDTKYTVTCKVNDSNMGELTCSPTGLQYAGTQITLTATPKSGYLFSSYSSTPSLTITDNKFELPADDVEITANFIADPYTYAKVTSADYPTATKNYGENTLTCTDGHEWTGNYRINGTSDESGNSNPSTLQLNTKSSYHILTPEVNGQIESITVDAYSTTTARYIAFLPVTYNEEKVTATTEEIIAQSAELASSKSTSSSQEIELNQKYTNQVKIYAIGGALYIKTITIKYSPFEKYQKSISDKKMATMYLPSAVTIPAATAEKEVKAYIAKDAGDHTAVTLTKITDGIIPAYTGVLLYSDEAATFDFVPTYDTSEEDLSENCFKGVTEKTAYNADGIIVDSKTNYALCLVSGSLGFYPVNSGSYAANSAYLQLPAQSGTEAKLMLNFDDEDNPTSIENVDANANANTNVIFNLAGQRINKLHKGINIVNGKKVLY